MTEKLRAIPVDLKTQSVAIGVTSNRIFRAGHVSLLLQYEDGSYVLAHKEPNGKASNFRAVWSMIRYGYHARIELILFPSREQLDVFQHAFQWRFIPVVLENPHKVSEYVHSLIDANDLDASVFCFAGKNCVDFVADLLKVGNNPRLPYHPIPLVFFDKLESLDRMPCQEP
ncbi:hypothetical protein [Oligoflexus tunisiensis]|uniref:hypothetical protein n=1 Tax=Oligoflexus tunisiensis TaxID=708132 RepID=UPI001C405218|nr:hypothetical protein [Oligoflexus tunisiensis]